MKSTKMVPALGMLVSLPLAILGFGCGASAPPPPISVSVSATTLSVDAGASSKITATVTNDSSNKGVAWTVTCPTAPCGSVSPTSTPSGAPTTYAAPAAPPASDVQITITATSAADATKSQPVGITFKAVTVNFAPGPTTVVTTGTAQLSANIGDDPSNGGINWSVSCSAASCGSVSPKKTLSGTPTTYAPPSGLTANLNVTVTATSVFDPTKSMPYPLTVVPPLVITTTSLPSGTGGVTYNQTLQATGGLSPYTWSMANGNSLPPGLGLNTDGSIHGSPTAGGTFNFTVQVADSGNPQLITPAKLSINVVILPLSISTTSLPNGTVDVSYKQSLQAAGGVPPYNWSISSGSLPTWVSFDSKGVLAGFPNAPGVSNFTVQVTDAETSPQKSTQPLSISVTPAAGANDAELKGHYAFLFSGFDDATGGELAIAGSFTADGAGNIISGIEDSNGPGGSTQNVPFTGAFNIGGDNRGAFTLQTASGTQTFAVVVGGITGEVASRGRFIRFDDTDGKKGQRGSGVLRLQDTTVFSLASVKGPYALGLVGEDSTASRSAIIGSVTADGAGKLTSGLADLCVAGTASNPSLTGTYTAPDLANGKSVLTLNISTAATWVLSTYVVSANELLAMSTDAIASEGLHSGSLLSQTSTAFADGSFSGATVLYDTSASTSAPPVAGAEIGLLTPDGKGSLPSNLDHNSGGSVGTVNFTAAYTVASQGRVTITKWGLNGTDPNRYLYLVDTNKAFYLDTTMSVGFGFIEPQAPAPAGGFTNASLSGTFLSGTVAPAMATLPTASAQGNLDGNNKFSETVDLSLATGLVVGQVTSGTYSITTSGRGIVTSLTTTATLVPIALLLLLTTTICSPRRRARVSWRPVFAVIALLVIGLSPSGCTPPKPPELVFYVISPTKFVLIDESRTDTNPVVAVFEQ
jgi:hypothetical protein